MTDGFVFARSEATWQSTVLSPIFWFFVDRIAHFNPALLFVFVRSLECKTSLWDLERLLT